MSNSDPLLRKHETFNLRDALNDVDRASPVGATLGQMVEGLLNGRLEYFTVFDDLRFPATAVNPPGVVSDPTFDTTFPGWLFDATSTESLYIIAQLPHSWKEGGELYPHVHWQKTTSAVGTVLWRMEYKWVPIGEVADAAYTTLDVSTPTVSDDDTANKHAVSSFGSLPATGKGLSDILVIQLSRVGGSDTYGANARLLEFDIHFEIDSLGSDMDHSKEAL